MDLIINYLGLTIEIYSKIFQINNMKRKISVTTGTRAEYGILRPVLKKIKDSKNLELVLIVTGTHLSRKHGMTINQINKDGFRIAAKFEMKPKGDQPYHMARSLGEGIIKFSEIFRKEKPDINLILGDRDEPFASAIAASHMNIPNAHIHGGEVSQSIDEYIRHAITKISNIHFAVTKKSRWRIIKMGENPRLVFLTGSPSIDEVIDHRITTEKDLEEKYNIKTKDSILLVYHPITTQHNESEDEIINILEVIIQLKKNIIAIYPNSDAGSEKILKKLQEYSKRYKHLRLFQSLPRNDYLGILKGCKALIGNSSSGIIEGSYFNTPIVNVGIRQKGREMSTNIINSENDKTSIKNALKIALTSNSQRKKSYVFGRGNASTKIVNILETINLDKSLIQKQMSY